MSEAHPFTRLPVPPGAVAIHWFGQSSFALKTPAATIVQLDPYFPRSRPAEKFLHASAPLDEATLRSDAVLLTHDHSDHTCLESLARIDDAHAGTRFIGPVESARRLRAAGIEVRDEDILSAGGVARVNEVTIHAVYAKPPNGDPARNIQPPDVTHLGYVITVGPMRLWFSGDPIHTFAELDEVVEPVHRLEPHVGFITTHPTEGEFPDFAGAVRTAQRVGLQTAVPQHYACFVKRTYDPLAFAAAFPRSGSGPSPFIIDYNSHVLFSLRP